MEQTGRFNLTVEERVLLHLLDYERFKEAVQVPPTVTQQGISRGVGIERKHVPRALKNMIDKSLVEVQKKHVSGKPQRMLTYFLTSIGAQEAKSLRTHLEPLSINIDNGTDTPLSMRLLEAPKTLGPGISVARIISVLDDDGTLHTQRLSEPKEPKERTKEDRLEIYKTALAQAWEDKVLTSDESDILRTLRDSLGISEKEHHTLEEEILVDVKEIGSNQALEVYKVAMEQAQADGMITEDERAILEKIKERFQLEDV